MTRSGYTAPGFPDCSYCRSCRIQFETHRSREYGPRPYRRSRLLPNGPRDGLDHDRGAMCVVSTTKRQRWPRSFWNRTQMSVWMYSTKKMADMNMSVGVWQRSGHKNLSKHRTVCIFSSFKSRRSPRKLNRAGRHRSTGQQHLTEDAGISPSERGKH